MDPAPTRGSRSERVADKVCRVAQVGESERGRASYAAHAWPHDGSGAMGLQTAWPPPRASVCRSACAASQMGLPSSSATDLVPRKPHAICQRIPQGKHGRHEHEADNAAMAGLRLRPLRCPFQAVVGRARMGFVRQASVQGRPPALAEP